MNPYVLHLNISDGGGGVGKAAYRLHHALCEQGVDSGMLVDFKTTRDPGVVTCGSRWYAPLRTRLDKLPRLLCKSDHWEYVSFNWLPNPEVKHAWTRYRPQILHLHWIGDGLLPLQYFPLFADLPTVATLHGRWLFNGAQHLHSDQSSRFVDGFLSGNHDPKDGGLDVDRWVWNRKYRYLATNPFEVIALSRWMQHDAQRSVLLGKRPVHLIPNGLDRTCFYPRNKTEARARLQLPQNKRLVLFGANFATRDRNKGYHDFVCAIQKIESARRANFEVVVFGSDRPSGPLPYKTHTHFLGYIRDEEELALAYSACDTFVLPSRQDNLPNTVMESLACGTPCVAYDVGGVSDMVESGENGFLVPARHIDALAERLEQMLVMPEDERRQMGANAVDRIQQEFDIRTQANRMHRLYQEVIERYANR